MAYEFRANDPLSNRITLAEQDKVILYKDGVFNLLSNVAHFFLTPESSKSQYLRRAWAEEVLVTDLSTLCDFLKQEQIDLVYEKSGLTRTEHSYIWELAKQIEDKWAQEEVK